MASTPGDVAFRLLTAADGELADSIMMPAYGTPVRRARELARYIGLQPDGWLLLSLDGRPAALGGAVDYGAFAHVGLVAVLPELQGRGLGRLLMGELLARLGRRGVPTVTLDASPAGAPLYERLGFEDESQTQIWRLADASAAGPLPEGVAPMRPADIEEAAALDAPAFGAPRAAVLASYLASYPARSLAARDGAGRLEGFLFAQDSAVGPWTAASPGAAGRLLRGALALGLPAGARACVPAANPHAAAALAGGGFAHERTLRQMRLGPAPARDRTMLYAQASLAIG